MHVAVIGGGASGVFFAICLKELDPFADVTIFEASNKLLSKVELSGGGRCNCTNTFENVKSLSDVYPRGANVMKSLFKQLSPKDTAAWFENHGVKLKKQNDGRVFPLSQDSHTVINCFLSLLKRYNVKTEYSHRVTSIEELHGFDCVIVSVGGYPNAELNNSLANLGHGVIKPLPSLFAFELGSDALRNLSGISVNGAELLIPATKFRAKGDLLLTHWGISGPLCLKLSSYAALYLSEKSYKSPLIINWTGKNYNQCEEMLKDCFDSNQHKLIPNINPFALPNSLWRYITEKSLKERAKNKISSLNLKDVNRLLNNLCSDEYNIVGKAPNKDEFVTCGGLSLQSLDRETLESKFVSNLYFTGEALDIDGITGGFNLQAAWTTAFVVAWSVYKKYLG